MSEGAVLAFAEAARRLADLGHPQRLEAFRVLVQAGETGFSVGAIERSLKAELLPPLWHASRR